MLLPVYTSVLLSSSSVLLSFYPSAVYGRYYQVLPGITGDYRGLSCLTVSYLSPLYNL